MEAQRKEGKREGWVEREEREMNEKDRENDEKWRDEWYQKRKKERKNENGVRKIRKTE